MGVFSISMTEQIQVPLWSEEKEIKGKAYLICLLKTDERRYEWRGKWEGHQHAESQEI